MAVRLPIVPAFYHISVALSRVFRISVAFIFASTWPVEVAISIPAASVHTEPHVLDVYRPLHMRVYVGSYSYMLKQSIYLYGSYSHITTSGEAMYIFILVVQSCIDIPVVRL